MKNISKYIYLSLFPVLVGVFIIGSINVVMGDLEISIPSTTDLHRTRLKSLYLGKTGTPAGVYLDENGANGENRLTVVNGLIMGMDNKAQEGASFVSIGGGEDNTMGAVEKSGIGGGKKNSISSSLSVIGGGSNNGTYGGELSTIAGGSDNQAKNGGVIVGGGKNMVDGESVIVGGYNNSMGGSGSMILGSNSKGGDGSFSWNSTIEQDFSAIIMADSGVLIGTYYPVTGVNLVVDGAIRVGNNDNEGIVGEIKFQSGCFYGYDGSSWHVINKKLGGECPNVGCAFGSILLNPGDSMQVYKKPYSSDCSQELLTGYCNVDGIFGGGGEYYAYCYNLNGEFGYLEQSAECGINGGEYVSNPVGGLCNQGTPSDVTEGSSTFTWTCTNGSSVESCFATRVYPCEGELPIGPGVITGNNAHVYASSVSSWTPVAQEVSPGACQWKCDNGYQRQGNTCLALYAQCGVADGSEFVEMPEANNLLCAGGNFVGEVESITSFSWKCEDSFGNEVSCSARRLYEAELQGDNAGMNNFTFGIIQLGNHYIMDRNLGADERWNGETLYNVYEPSVQGYFYKWGNNYGYSRDGSCEDRNLDQEYMNNVCNYENDQIVPSSCKYIDGYLCPGEGPWFVYDNDDLDNIYDFWGARASSDELRQGPCPYGWHIPSIGDINKMLNTWNSLNPSSCSFDQYLLLPKIGIHSAYGSNPIPDFTNYNYSNYLSYHIGGYGNAYPPSGIWVASEARAHNEGRYNGSEAYKKLFTQVFDIDSFINGGCQHRMVEGADNTLTEMGFPVRCFRNDQ